MSDSNATKRICELLAERGIDYKLRRASATSARETVFWEYEKDGDWTTAEYAVTVPLDGYGTLEASHLTPEQAIAATLGSEREKALEELVLDMWPLVCKYREMATTFAYQPGLDEAISGMVAIGEHANIRERMRTLGLGEVDND